MVVEISEMEDRNTSTAKLRPQLQSVKQRDKKRTNERERESENGKMKGRVRAREDLLHFGMFCSEAGLLPPSPHPSLKDQHPLVLSIPPGERIIAVLPVLASVAGRAFQRSDAFRSWPDAKPLPRY